MGGKPTKGNQKPAELCACGDTGWDTSDWLNTRACPNPKHKDELLRLIAQQDAERAS
jgi:hypothetical protein